MKPNPKAQKSEISIVKKNNDSNSGNDTDNNNDENRPPPTYLPSTSIPLTLSSFFLSSPSDFDLKYKLGFSDAVAPSAATSLYAPNLRHTNPLISTTLLLSPINPDVSTISLSDMSTTTRRPSQPRPLTSRI
jgi:hypothetical protein